jgi:hypothetical protein
MAFSIWEYLRERTRDAVLAGFQDALDIAEKDDTEGSQHAAASRLGTRLAAGSLTQASAQIETPPPAAEAKSLPHPSMNGQSAVNGGGASAPTAKAPSRPVDASTFDDDLERRLNDGAAQNGHESPQPPPHIGRQKRGRPPKRRETSQ